MLIVSKQQLFYVDILGVLQNLVLNDSLTSSDPLSLWAPGSLGAHSFKATIEPGTGLAIGHNNGSSDLFPPSNSPSLADDAGLNIVVGGEDGLVHEFKYSISNNSWVAGYTFPESNGYGGCCGKMH